MSALIFAAITSVADNDQPGLHALPPPRQFVTRHQVTIGGQRIDLTATAGETWLYNDDDEPIGSLFSYAYVKDGAPESRPVMFITGGGPGSASHFLHVGFIGPWAIPVGRIALDGSRAPSVTPPFDVVDNPNSLLDVADLVFIDPIGTGYSRVIGNGKPEYFWGVDEDLDSIAQFIQLWLTKNGRWSSPKFFLGESYGGTRAALLPNTLMGGPMYPGYLRAIALNGVIVLVNGLASALGTEGVGAAVLAATDVPSQAAAAWYHNKIDRRGRSLSAFYDEATQFALSEYAEALRRGAANTLTAQERAAVVAQLITFTGLPASAYEKKLALPRAEFAKLLLAGRGLKVGIYDSRYTFPLAATDVEPVADDAYLARSFPVLTGAFLNMEHSKLKVDMGLPFAALHWRDLLTKWNMKRRGMWTSWEPRTGGPTPAGATHGNNAEELALAMNRNQNLYALVACGYYDLLMPAAQATYSSQNAKFPKDRLTIDPFEAGHEPYADKAVDKLAHDIRDFIRKASR